MERIVDYIHAMLFKVLVPLQEKLFPEGTTTSLYLVLKSVVRLVVYGFLACVLASVTGTKKYIDKKMKWAQR